VRSSVKPPYSENNNLIDRTRQVWQLRLGRDLSCEDARQIAENVTGRSGDGWTARCPAHDDRHNSLSIHHRDGRWLLRCHAGCGWQEIVDALGVDAADLFDGEEGRRGRVIPSDNRATVQPTPGSSPEDLALVPSSQQG
jgi:hypothetical protein